VRDYEKKELIQYRFLVVLVLITLLIGAYNKDIYTLYMLAGGLFLGHALKNWNGNKAEK